ncbi:MAG TPA: DUF1573 domain-containing protein [Luteibaculaceae bacterium]|nr:DUF1573 domain-containing protein [Luteibaculaceae bacterium]
MSTPGGFFCGMVNKLLFFTFLFATCNVLAQPVVRFHQNTVQLPSVREGDPVRFKIAVSNDGNQPLIFTDSKVACKCTRVFFPLRPIAPGAVDSVAVFFDTEGKVGLQQRKVDLFSNASNNPAFFKFKFMVKRRRD